MKSNELLILSCLLMNKLPQISDLSWVPGDTIRCHRIIFILNKDEYELMQLKKYQPDRTIFWLRMKNRDGLWEDVMEDVIRQTPFNSFIISFSKWLKEYRAGR